MPAWAPTSVFEPLLASVMLHHGIMHQLFHPFHTVKPEVADAFRMSVRRAREEGLEWWTARQINDWERTRRRVRVEKQSGASITLRASTALSDATILRLDRESGDFTAWGFNFTAVVTSIQANTPIEIQFPATPAAS
jgi:hypothetical protein